MHLVGRREAIGTDAEGARRARPVLEDEALVVLRADAAIEARVDARGDAADAGEERVPDAGQRLEQTME